MIYPNVNISASRTYPWIDFAKGFCISFVVLGHTAGWFERNFPTEEAPVWMIISEFFQSVRMPLFFMVSGLLAASKMGKPPSELWDKTIGLYIIYVLWTALYCVKLALPGGRDGHPYPSGFDLALTFIFPTNLWYIWALPVYVAVAYSLHRGLGRHRGLGLLPAILLSIFASDIASIASDITSPPLEPVHAEETLFNFLWFYLGISAKNLVFHATQTASYSKLGAASVFFFATNSIFFFSEPSDKALVLPTIFGLWFALEVLGIMRYEGRIVQSLCFVGRSTLPIYVQHMFLLTGLTWLVNKTNLAETIYFSGAGMHFWGPLTLTLIVMTSCILSGTALRRIPGFRYLVVPVPNLLRPRTSTQIA